MFDSIAFPTTLVAHHLQDSSSQDWVAKDSRYHFPLGAVCGLIGFNIRRSMALRYALLPKCRLPGLACTRLDVEADEAVR